MRELKWKKVRNFSKDNVVSLGGMKLECDYARGKWRSYVSFGKEMRAAGPYHSLEKAKTNCVLMAKLLLVEHHCCLVRAMKHFGISCEDDT